MLRQASINLWGGITDLSKNLLQANLFPVSWCKHKNLWKKSFYGTYLKKKIMKLAYACSSALKLQSLYGTLVSSDLIGTVLAPFLSSVNSIFDEKLRFTSWAETYHSKLSSNGSKCYNTRKKEPWQPRSCIEEIWLTISKRTEINDLQKKINLFCHWLVSVLQELWWRGHQLDSTLIMRCE